MEITHFGSGICSHNCRITGAILFETRPAMIMRSLCRGEGRNTSAPKRAISKRDAPIDIISIAQQARPNVIGQIESGQHHPFRRGIAESQILDYLLAVLGVDVGAEVKFGGHDVLFYLPLP